MRVRIAGKEHNLNPEEREEANTAFQMSLSKLRTEDPEFLELLRGVIEARLDGIARYGAESYCDLGSKGVFVDVNRKHTRLKRHFWEEKRLGSEKIEDSMFDNIVYLFLLFKSHLRSK